MLPALCLLLAACSSGAPAEPELPDAGDVIELELDVKVLGSSHSSRPALSRATMADDYDPAAYSTEDLSHLRVIIVNNASGEIIHNRGIRFSNGEPVADDMRFAVKPTTTYRIYLLGNCEGSANLNFGITRLPVGSTYPTRFIEDKCITRTQGAPLYNNTTPLKTNIPMSEVFTVTTDQYNGSFGQTQLVPLFITRAASKFSFSITAADDYTPGESPALTSIRILGLANQEYLLPRDAVYNPAKDTYSTNKYNGREIVSFSAPAHLSYSAATFRLPEPLSLQPGMEPLQWSPELYFAETPLTSDGISCTLTFGNGDSHLVPIPLPNLPYGLPRNTFVKVEIVIGNNNAIKVEMKVVPWTQHVSEFDYSDEVNIASDGALAFVSGTYRSLDKTEGRLVLNNYPAAATGSFGIATPIGMRWDAYLLTESGDTDAIQFRLPDGSTSTSISGFINAGTKEQFSIVPVNPAGDTPNIAILQVVVTTADGRGIPANILYGGGYGADVKNLTIIQNPQ